MQFLEGALQSLAHPWLGVQEHPFTLLLSLGVSETMPWGCLPTTNLPPYYGEILLPGLLGCGDQTRKWVGHLR